MYQFNGWCFDEHGNIAELNDQNIKNTKKMLHTEKKFLKFYLKSITLWEFDVGIDISNNVEQDLFLIQDLLFFVLNQALKIIYNNLKGKNVSDAK